MTDLTLQVPAGSGFAPLGPNGAGKTTSLKEFRKRLGMSEIIRFPGYAGYGDTGPAIDITPDWLSQAELVIVLTIPAGTGSRSLEVTGFEIAEAPARPPG